MKKLGIILILALFCAVPLNYVSGDQTGVIISTPQADGAIYHHVVDGDTLEGIATAYGMTPSEIMTLNGNSPTATEIYIGDFLLIKRGTVATATSEPTPTIAPYTPQPTVFEPSRTPIPSKTALPSPTPTLPPSTTQRLFGDSQRIGLTMIAVSTVGIILVVIFGFLRKPE